MDCNFILDELAHYNICNFSKYWKIHKEIMDCNCHHCDTKITENNYGSKMGESDNFLCDECFNQFVKSEK